MTAKSAVQTAAILAATAAAFSIGRRRVGRMSVEGRAVLITGGSRGLGLALARQFGALGAHVTLAARDQAELNAAREDLTSRGIGCAVLPCDLTDPLAVSRLVEQVVAERGRLDILV